MIRCRCSRVQALVVTTSVPSRSRVQSRRSSPIGASSAISSRRMPSSAPISITSTSGPSSGSISVRISSRGDCPTVTNATRFLLLLGINPIPRWNQDMTPPAREKYGRSLSLPAMNGPQAKDFALTAADLTVRACAGAPDEPAGRSRGLMHGPFSNVWI